MKQVIAKQKDHAFGKNVYLLGKDKDGIMYWLEAPTWDCGWYWGFGYVETYRYNRLPRQAKDIDSHSHIGTSFTGKCHGEDSEYVHNIFDCKTFASVTFTEEDGWILSDLFDQFYKLNKVAEIFKNGGSNLTSQGKAHSKLVQNLPMVKRINEIMIPSITERIIDILKPQ